MTESRSLRSGGGGIRTLDTPLERYNTLAGCRLQPLGHSSERRKYTKDLCAVRRLLSCVLDLPDGLLVDDVRLLVGWLGVQDLLARDLLFDPDERGVQGGAEEDGEGGDVQVEEQDDDRADGAVGLVVGVEVAAKVSVEGQAREHPEGDADEAAGRDPAKRLARVRGEVEEQGDRRDHEEERRGPPRHVPHHHELVAQGEDLGDRLAYGGAGDQEQDAAEDQDREAQRHKDRDALDLPEGPRLLHVVGAVEGVY